MRLFAAGVWFQ